MHTVLIIAGSDPTGGAGLAADLRTCSALGVHATLAVSAVSAQSAVEVAGTGSVGVETLRAQLEAVDATVEPAAIKVGLLSEVSLVEEVGDYLERHATTPVVLDPVLRASSGPALVDEGVDRAIMNLLVPRADLVTPNHPEMETLLGRSVAPDPPALVDAGREFLSLGARAVLLKGGHREGELAQDLLLNDAGVVQDFAAPRIGGLPARGTGCALSSAVACFLSRGRRMEDAVGEAKTFVHAAIDSSYFIGWSPMRIPHLFWEYYGGEGLP